MRQAVVHRAATRHCTIMVKDAIKGFVKSPAYPAYQAPEGSECSCCYISRVASSIAGVSTKCWVLLAVSADVTAVTAPVVMTPGSCSLCRVGFFPLMKSLARHPRHCWCEAAGGRCVTCGSICCYDMLAHWACTTQSWPALETMAFVGFPAWVTRHTFRTSW
jgi:hypothetical protein